MIAVCGAGIAVVIDESDPGAVIDGGPAGHAARASAAWAALTADNPACSCCDSASSYRQRVNEVGAILGMPAWNGKPSRWL